LEYITKRLDRMKHDAGAWQPSNYPHLHTPLSSSVVLQWTLRNGSLVNLPWALLVEGDVILIKPGQVRKPVALYLLLSLFRINVSLEKNHVD
jgi:hypothetical protein